MKWWVVLVAVLSMASPAGAQALSDVPSDTEETFAQTIDRFLEMHPMPPRDLSHRRMTVEDIVDDLAPYLIGGAIATATIALIGAGVFLIRRARP